MFALLVETFAVAHQSAKYVVLPTSRRAVPLYCIASTHNSHILYHWDNLSGDVGLLSPVYYAHKCGVYRCTVEDSLGNKCYSKSIEVIDGTLLLCIYYVREYSYNVTYFSMI